LLSHGLENGRPAATGPSFRRLPRALIGYEPKVLAREGLARTFAAFKAMYA
jgi:hypothetical protein